MQAQPIAAQIFGYRKTIAQFQCCNKMHFMITQTIRTPSGNTYNSSAMTETARARRF